MTRVVVPDEYREVFTRDLVMCPRCRNGEHEECYRTLTGTNLLCLCGCAIEPWPWPCAEYLEAAERLVE